MTDKGNAILVEKTWGGGLAGSLRGRPRAVGREPRAGRAPGLGLAPHVSSLFPLLSFFVNSEWGQVRASFPYSYTLKPEQHLLCFPHWESL